MPHMACALLRGSIYEGGLHMYFLGRLLDVCAFALAVVGFFCLIVRRTPFQRRTVKKQPVRAQRNSEMTQAWVDGTDAIHEPSPVVSAPKLADQPSSESAPNRVLTG